MYGEFIIVDQPGTITAKWKRLPLGETSGRNEAWLRDLLINNPEILPVHDIDSAYGPLIPLCTELRTDAGPADAAFINHDGKLTIVETKLWRNPEARRKVVAQALDYARALATWSYSDLQRQVSSRLGRPGNVPFQLANAVHSELEEKSFVDATTRSLQAGRFLLMIVGDGIREDVEALAELINRNAATAFQLAVVEAALYDAGNHSVAVQMRVLMKTQLLERFVILPAPIGTEKLDVLDDIEDGQSGPSQASPRSPDIRAWWEPILNMEFDDPDQPSPTYGNNYVRARLPWTGLSISAYREASSDDTGVFIGGATQARKSFFEAAFEDLKALASQIEGCEVHLEGAGGKPDFYVIRKGKDFESDDQHRKWIMGLMNRFSNELRPLIHRLQRQHG